MTTRILNLQILHFSMKMNMGIYILHTQCIIISKQTQFGEKKSGLASDELVNNESGIHKICFKHVQSSKITEARHY